MPAIKSLGREPIDGRPLYQYRLDLTSLDMLEAAINHPLYDDSRRIQALAPVAAARFASNYEGGPPSWEHCGPEVLRLYQANGGRFRVLMDASFGLYRIPIVTRPGADLLLETVIGQAGLPSGMLRPGRPVRLILDRLMQEAALGHCDLLDESKRLVDLAAENDDLRSAYKRAGHLPKLCADLVTAVTDLTTQAQWDGGALDRVWQVPGWERALPFRVDAEAAREIVSHLLNVAIAATKGAGCSIERRLLHRNGEWYLSTRAAVGVEGIELPSAQRDVLAVYYAISNEPVGEAFRLRRKEGQRFVLAAAVKELSKSAPDRPVTLVMNMDGVRIPLESVGGAPLEEGSLWVFESRTEGFAYRSAAPVRLRAPELIVAVPQGTSASEDAVQLPQHLVTHGIPRVLWKVTGKARFTTADGDVFLVESGYSGPQGYLDFRGRTPTFRVPGFSTVFLGDPAPRRIGGLIGRIEWRRVGESAWTSMTSRAAIGHLQFRLVDPDGEVIAERRRVLVLPEVLRPKLSSRHVSLTLPEGMSILSHVAGEDGVYTIEFGTASRLQLRLKMQDTQFELQLDRPMPASFTDLTTGEEHGVGVRQISSVACGRFVASSVLHDRVEVRRTSDHWSAVHSIALRDHRLPLSDALDFLVALAFHPRGRTHALRVQFPNGPGIEIEPYRIRRGAGLLQVIGAASEFRIQLRELQCSAQAQTTRVIELQKEGADTWLLPDAEGFSVDRPEFHRHSVAALRVALFELYR